MKHKPSNSFVTTCLTVNGLKRNLFILPRETMLDSNEPVNLMNLHEEISGICKKHKITKFAMKKVSRKYAFEIPNIPEEADYMKLVYDYGTATLFPSEAGKTFSHVFGANISSLETFLLKRKVMGPCWLEIKNHNFQKRNVGCLLIADFMV